MKSKNLLVSLIIILALIVTIVSCENELDSILKNKTPSIKGRITIPSSSSLSVEDIWLKVTGGNETKYVGKVNSDGTFEVKGLNAEIKYNVLFTSLEPDYLNASRDLKPKTSRASGGGYGGWLADVTAAIDESNDVGSVKMKPLGTIKGVAKLADLEEHYDTLVYIPGTSFMAITDKEGNYAISSVPQGTHTLRYTADGHVSVMKEKVLLHSDSDTENPVLELSEVALVKNVGSVQGVAKLSGANDHAGINIKLENGETSKEGTTSQDGSFNITEVIPGTYKAIVTYPSYLTQTVEDIQVNTNETTTIKESIELVANGGKISGSVKLNDLDTFEGVLVAATSNDNKYSYTASTSPDGEFLIDNCHPATYKITISKAGYETKIIEDVESASGRNSVIDEITLNSIYGKAGGKVTLSNSDEVNGVTILLKGDKNYQANTTIDGTYQFSGIEVGYYDAEISKLGYSTQFINNVYIESGKTTNIDKVTLIYSSSAVTGKVFLEGKSNYSGTTVRIISTTDESNQFSKTTAEDGTYYLANIPAGEYSIEVQAQGYLTDRSKKIILDVGVVKTVESITLQSVTSTVVSTITLGGAANHIGTNILLVASDEREDSYSTTTAQDGSFTLTKVNPGPYTLYASHEGYQSYTKEDIFIESSTTKTIDSKQLEVAIKSVTGKVLLELKNDHAGALVTATNINNTERIYSAITNSSGNFTLAGIISGEYEIVIFKEGYRSVTLPTVNIVSSSSITLAPVDLPIARGTISGLAILNGKADHSGIKVELIGTSEKAITNSAGYYSFYVPSGNYPGVRFSKVDFETTSSTGTITVLTDNIYEVLEKRINATHNTVVGSVNVEGTNDHSDVAVSFDGTSFNMITTADGEFRFDHVPLGNYTLRYQRENAPVITTDITVEPAPEIVVPTVTLLPQQASIYGYVKLDGMTNFSGIKIEVKNNETSEVISIISNADGYFYIPNILISGTYTVSFSKQGWDTQSITVTNLIPLENRYITQNDPIVLLDTTTPQVGDFTINGGSNFTDSKIVSLQIPVIEKGSGVESMQLRLNGKPENPNWQPYSLLITTDLEDIFAPNFVGNGEYNISVRVRDFAGNVSEWVDDSIVLTDQKTIVKGILTGNKLHWKKISSPYRVEGHILVPKGETLIIDPGVEVLFADDYYIRVEGAIQAKGTSNQNIRFRSDDDYSGEWRHLELFESEPLIYQDGIPISGNTFEYTTFQDASVSILMHTEIIEANISNCIFLESNQTALFAHTSNSNLRIVDNQFYSPIRLTANNVVFTNNDITDTYLKLTPVKSINTDNFILSKNNFYSSYLYGYLYEPNYPDCYFSYNTFVESINPIILTDQYAYSSSRGINFTYTNFIDCQGILVNTTSSKVAHNLPTGGVIRVDNRYIDFSNSFWGYSNTEELISPGFDGNASFIRDYYDDFSFAAVKFANFYEEPIRID